MSTNHQAPAKGEGMQTQHNACTMDVKLDGVPVCYFASYIASFTLTMLQYNILCTVKRFDAYETIGGLFTKVPNDTLELSVTDKIRAIILDFVLEAEERYSIDATELLADFIESNPVVHALRDMYIYKQAS